MGEFTIKRITSILILLLVAFLFAGCGQNDEEENSQESESVKIKKEIAVDLDEEQKEALFAESKDVIEEFNQIYLAKTQEEYEKIITNTWVDSETMIRSTQDIFDRIQEQEETYTDIAFDYSEEDINAISEDKAHFVYLAKVEVTLTNENGETENYETLSEYNFEKTEDGNYKLNQISALELELE